MKTQTCSEIGKMGEDEAVRYMLSIGFEIRHRNWRSGRCELDIVALRDGVLHVVEVKCRKSRGVTTPEQAISAKKYAMLSQGAVRYMDIHGHDGELSIDLLAIEHDLRGGFELRYIEDIRPTQWLSVE